MNRIDSPNAISDESAYARYLSDTAITPATLGVDLEGQDVIDILECPIRLYDSHVVENGKTIYAAEIESDIDPNRFYSLLSQIRPYKKDSQPVDAAVADWRKPEFVENHRKRGPVKWDALGKHLQFMCDLMMPPQTIPYTLTRTVNYLRSPEVFYRLAQVPGKYHRFITSSEGYNDYFTQGVISTEPGSIINLFRNFIFNQGYEILQPLVADLKEKNLLLHDDDNTDDLITLVKNPQEGFDLRISADQLTTLARMLYQPKHIVMPQNGHEFAQPVMDNLVQRFVLSLGETPADRALKLMYIAHYGLPVDDEDFLNNPVDYVSTLSPDKTSDSIDKFNDRWRSEKNGNYVFQRTGNYTFKDLYRDKVVSVDDPEMWWFSEPGVGLGHRVRPLLVWTKRANGKRTFVYDEETARLHFPEAFMERRDDRGKIVPNQEVGFLTIVYTQPEVAATMPPELDIPKVHGHDGALEGPDVKQPMRQGQVPFLAMIMEKVFMLEPALLEGLEQLAA